MKFPTAAQQSAATRRRPGTADAQELAAETAKLATALSRCAPGCHRLAHRTGIPGKGAADNATLAALLEQLKTAGYTVDPRTTGNQVELTLTWPDFEAPKKPAPKTGA